MKKPKKNPKGDAAKGGADGAKKGGMVGKLALVVAMGATSFCTVFFLPKEDTVTPEHVEAGEHDVPAVEELPPEPIVTAFLDMESFTVSLKGRRRILRLGVALEAPEDMVEFIDPNDPQLRDAFMGYLSAIDIAQVEDAAFLVRLRSQLTRRAKFVLGDANVQNVLITDFLVR
ncbi:MAG: hypothetical protein COA69_11790 [Robiginitomaculum sp.]|nr:MAG: hypothetical protein COA69_11790 [Robiginitomaculum sp.]